MPKILAIDDLEENLQMLQVLLNVLIPNTEVKTAVSGKKGIKMLDNELFDIILLDITMPELDGFEVCEILKSNERTKKIPIIILTAIHIDTKSKIKALEVGADAFLSKPIDQSELVAVINAMLRIKNAEDELRKDKERLQDLVEERTLQIRQTEQRFSIFFENIENVAFVLNEQFNIIECNKSAEKNFDLKKENILGKNISEIFKGNETLINYLKQNSDYKANKSINFLSSNNINYEMLWNVSVLSLNDNEKQYMIIAQDITKIRDTQKKLVESENKFRTYLKQSPNGMILLDANANIIEWNSAINHFFKKRNTDIENRNFYTFLYDILSKNNNNLLLFEDVKNIITDILQKKNLVPQSISLSIFNTYKKEIFFEIMTFPIQTKNQIRVGIIFQDTTKYMRTKHNLIKIQKKIKSSLLFLSALLDTIPTPVFYKDNDGVYLGCNQSFVDYIGTPKDEIVGHNVYDIFPKSEADIYYSYDKELIEKKEKQNYQAKVKHADGTFRDIIFDNALFYNQDEEIGGIVGTFIDISPLKKIEDKLIAAKKKAEDSDSLKTAFLSNMSHEIRTPMNSIIGFAGLLKKENLMYEKRFGYSNYIINSCSELLFLLENIMELAKIETNQITLNRKEFNVEELLYELINECNNKKLHVKKERLELKIYKEKETLKIIADRFRLKQCLTHLLINALKFTERGYIELGYKLIKNQEIIFFVKDTGIGIREEKRKDIFNRFQKVQADNQRLYSGVGLGLTITKNLIEIMKGSIWVKSEPNKGSVFYFKIPFLKTTQKNTVMNLDWSNKTILIVEDEIINFIFLEEALLETKVKIIHAKTGTEAFNFIKTNKEIDLILMDIKMPEMNGKEATRLIRDISKIPIIAQTAYAMAGDKDEILNAGCNDYIAKPIKQENLIKIISKFF